MYSTGTHLIFLCYQLMNISTNCKKSRQSLPIRYQIIIILQQNRRHTKTTVIISLFDNNGNFYIPRPPLNIRKAQPCMRSRAF